ncbi:MAG TPA: TlyA family RNA methyltransferase [Burkholderiaceae bacterium]|nr:TlyA family RNA methyltransferase [Burkholderiaceae bacterium]
MTRIDQLLVAKSLAPTRSAAQRLIERGGVRWLGPNGWTVPRKAGDDVPPDCPLEVTDAAELRWASRGGLKLEAALHHTGLDVRGRLCLDAGQSTGGFTDVLIASGARHVVGVDVGHGQLLQRLRGDPRITALEGLNARDLRAEALPFPCYDLIVGDLSFISLTLVLPALASLLRGDLLMLVKPQFELQPGHIGKGGLVKDRTLYARVEQRIRDACIGHRLLVHDWFPSPITGGDGNQEFFVWAASPLQGSIP